MLNRFLYQCSFYYSVCVSECWLVYVLVLCQEPTPDRSVWLGGAVLIGCTLIPDRMIGHSDVFSSEKGAFVELEEVHCLCSHMQIK